MSVEMQLPKSRRMMPKSAGSAYGESRLLVRAARLLVLPRRIRRGDLIVPVTVTGCAFALVVAFPSVLSFQIPAVTVIPVILVAYPRIQQVVLELVRREASPRLTRLAPGLERRSTPAGSLPSRAAFLRSFDRLEEILQGALTLEIGEIASQFMLRDLVEQLGRTGFLTSADRDQWAGCLAVRRLVLLADDDQSAPSNEVVERSLATMLALQVCLIDRRRALFDEEQEIREQEDTALQEAAVRMG